MMEPFPPYFDLLPQLSERLAKNKSLGLVVLDFTSFAPIEEHHGAQIYEKVRNQLFQMIQGEQGKAFREDDILALDEPRGQRVILIMDRSRHSPTQSPTNIRSSGQRIYKSLSHKLARAALPYLKVPPLIVLGQSMAIYNPLVHPSRIMRHALNSALDDGDLERRIHDQKQLEQVQKIILEEQIETSFQPIVCLRNKTVLGYEALSKGTSRSGMKSATLLFEAATRHHLLVELDRVCRMKALLCAKRLEPKSKIFINTLPVAVRDPEFRDKHLINFLARSEATPDRIVLEITEKLAIENYALFQEGMHYYMDLGMSLAVDDVGSGYSGLETIASLKPKYLKVDRSLIRDIHNSVVNREMVSAIISLGRGINAKVIGEGIENAGELLALTSMGVEYGQGFFLGTPDIAI